MLTTIRHLVWHDMRALRVTLAVWVGILAMQVVVIAIGPVLVGRTIGDEMSDMNAGQGMLVVRVAMTVILTALIIQRDTGVGTTAFWLTRPIPRAAMWTAKLVGIAGWCLVLPALVIWALFAGLGLSVGSAFGAAWVLLGEQTMVVAFSLMAASLTETLAHFVVAGLAGFAAVWFLSINARVWRDAVPALITLPGQYAILFAWLTAVVGGALAVSAHQYLTRRRIRTWLLAVVCLAVAQGTLVLVRNTPAQDPTTWSGRAYTPPAGVDVRLGDNVTDEPAGVTAASGLVVTGRLLSTLVWATSPSDTDALEPVGVRSSIATTTGPLPTVVRWSEPRRRGAWSISQQAALDDQPYRSMRMALGVDRMSFPASTAVPLFQVYVAEWPLAAYRAFTQKGGGRLRADVVVKAYRYGVGGAMPLREGASTATGDRKVSVAGIERTPRGIAVTVRTVFLSPFDAVVSRQGAVHYVLRNRARREAIFFTDQATSNIFLTLGIGAGSRPGTGLRRFEFDSQRAVTGRLALTDEWVTGAELVVLIPEDLGVFTREAETWVPAARAAR
jgi:hypothetical protein